MNKETRVFKFGKEYLIPEYCEYKDNNGFLKWGLDNNYPEYLLSLKKKSGKHSAIIDGKAKLIGGNGIKKEGLSPQALEFIKNPYCSEDLEIIISRISKDLEIFGGFALNVVWSNDMSSIAVINYIDIANCRIKYNDNKRIYYSKNWNEYKKVVESYEVFNPNGNEAASTIMFVNENYRYYYPVPEYGCYSTINCIELEYEISNFHINNIKKGFFPSAILTFNSTNPEERDTISEMVEATFCGSENTGRLMVNFTDSIDANPPKIETFQPNDLDEMFITINKESEKGIYQGHGVTNPSLFGVKTEGELGGTKEQSEDLKVFNSFYVIPKQKFIMNHINQLAKINGIEEELELNLYEIPVEMDVNPDNLMQILESGLPPATKKQILLMIGYKEIDADALIKTL